MPRKGFTRCKFCNMVIMRDPTNADDWIHAATRTVSSRYYGCNCYLSNNKKLGDVMRSFGSMGIAQAEPATTTTTENPS